MSRLIAVIAVVVLTAFGAGAISFLGGFPPTSTGRTSHPEEGAISGRVIDRNGRAVEGALVIADRSDVILRPAPRAWTGKDGAFVISGLTAGTYTLHTRKEEDGYARTDFNFYDEGETPEPNVLVYPDQATPNVTIQFAARAAILKGVITDARTNQPLKSAQVTVRRIDYPDRFLTTGLFWHDVPGGFRLLVPALAFTLKVSAPGYEDWYYLNSETDATPGTLLLASETTRELKVALRRRPTKGKL